MVSLSRNSFLKNAISLLIADIFFHPLWQLTSIKDPAEARQLADALKREVKSLSDKKDWLNVCRVYLACAYLQNIAGNSAEALDSLRSVDRIAQRRGLITAAIWAAWGASAICTQSGNYHQAAEHLLYLQKQLYSEGNWILGDIIELVQKSVEEWSSSGSNPIRHPRLSDQDQVGQLIEKLLCWGVPPNKTTNEIFTADGKRDEIQPFSTLVDARLPRGGHFFQAHHTWQNLLHFLHRFLRGEIRLELVDAAKFNAEPSLQIPMTALKVSPSLPGENSAAAKVVVQGTESDQESKALTSAASELNSQAVFQSSVQITNPEPGTLALPEKVNIQIDQVYPGQRTLSASFLGTFTVTLDGISLSTWPSGRSKAVFAYLLAHHDHPIPREVLMETFWPESTIDSARNSLNVAIYNLRHSLKAFLDTPIIFLHESTAYQINPDLHLWIDAELFELRILDARHQEISGEEDSAAAAYQQAIDLYKGDFLSDAPFEGWTTLDRERLRVMYLEALDHLSIIHFKQERYNDCIDLCQRILVCDACREDAHRRLMQCYARHGQANLALRQFQTCVDALRNELDVLPSPATMQLYEKIKRQELV